MIKTRIARRSKMWRVVRGAVLSALVGALFATSGCGRSDAPPLSAPGASAGVEVSATSPTGPTETPGTDDFDEDEGSTAPADKAASVAAAFAKAWARPNVGAERWWKKIAPLCEKRFAEKMRSVDPANLPATKVTGQVKKVGSDDDGTTRFTVATDGGTLHITLAAIGGKWVVAGNNFTRSGR
jgi:hypothetical protein